MAKPLVGAPIGADVDGVYTGTTTDGANSPLQLGTVVNGIDGTTYQLVQAAASLMASTRAPNAVAIDENYQAALMTTALAGAGHGLGFAPQAVIADNAFFWARINGSNFNHRAVASASADTFLRTSITAGRLATGSTASAVYFPAVLVTAASGSTSAANTVREVLAGRLAAVRAGLAGLP